MTLIPDIVSDPASAVDRGVMIWFPFVRQSIANQLAVKKFNYDLIPVAGLAKVGPHPNQILRQFPTH